MSVTLVGLGDSISYGLGDHGPGWIGPSWVSRVAHQVAARRVVHLCTPGQRIGDFTRVQVPAATAVRADYALVSIGGNDLLRPDFSPARLFCEVARTLRRLQRIGTRTAVLGLPDPSVHPNLPQWLRRVLEQRVRLFNDALNSAVATEPSASFVDLWDDPATRSPDYWHIDRMHPSPTGHQHIADVVIEKLPLTSVRPPLPTSDGASEEARTDAWDWWVHEGLPWAARRSIDVIPQMALALVLHPLGHRRREIALRRIVTSSAVDLRSGAPPARPSEPTSTMSTTRKTLHTALH